MTKESKGLVGIEGKSLRSSAGGNGAQNSNEGPLTCGGGGQGFAWWCHEIILV